MNIMVFDVAAESGGALSVLTDYYNEYCGNVDNNYFFILSKPLFEQKPNIKVINITWVKKSWFHRIIFDLFFTRSLIKRFNIDIVISLQNIIIPFYKSHQTILVHNVLPFSDYKIHFSQSPKLWFYQNFIGFLIRQSCRKADNIIVQTNWMKRRCIEQLNINANKIIVKPPIKEIMQQNSYRDSNEKIRTFFYPAGGEIYKNHKVIVDACKILKDKNVKDFEVIFTLSGNENHAIKKLKSCIDSQKLPIKFIGKIVQQDVYKLYSYSILLFPSYIETVGLPLLEAKSVGAPIIVANCIYSRDALSGYENCHYFCHSDCEALSRIMEEQIQISEYSFTEDCIVSRSSNFELDAQLPGVGECEKN